ncbi:hypothetical protein [Paenibacillus faecalis]|uniref:hypothetical protein n=1 Tax=Paenibacillus faecalis TaxID=2079532 RepID=UPI000D0E357E|nr:hypothetical protein [Paenibacillus faecalis]
MLEEEGGETLFTYNVSRFYYGAFRAVIFYVIYLILVFVGFHFTVRYSSYEQFIAFFVQIAVQTFFFCGLGFISMVLIRQMGWALFVVIGYAFLQILTGGKLFPYLNVYYFRGELPAEFMVDSKMLLTFLAGVMLWTLAQSILNKTQRYV